MERRTIIKRRILRRKKRRFKGLLVEVAKELSTSYLCTVVKSSPSGSPIIQDFIQEAKDIRKRLTSRFSTFLKAHPVLQNEDVIPNLLYKGRYPSIPIEATKSSNQTLPATQIGDMNKGKSVTANGDSKLLNTPPRGRDENSNKKQNSPVSIEQTLRLVANEDGGSGRKRATPKPPKKYSEKMKAEASILQRVGELQKEGMWYDKRLPKVKEPDRRKTHWDFVLEEAMWMHMDFQQEKKWKQMASKKISKGVRRFFYQKDLAALREKREEDIRIRRTASFMAREVQKFWGNVKRVIELREQTRIEELRKKALDQQLSFIVDQTEKYSDLLAEKFKNVIKKDEFLGDKSNVSDEFESATLESHSDVEFEPKSASEDDEETIAKAETEVPTEDVSVEVKKLQEESQMDIDDLINDLPEGYLENRLKPIPGEEIQEKEEMTEELTGPSSVVAKDAEDDAEFAPPSEMESDFEKTIDDEEEKEAEEGEHDHQKEIKELEAENELTVEQLVEKYYANVTEEDLVEIKTEIETGDEEEDEEMDSIKLDSESESEEESELETADLIKENENDTELASLLKTFAPDAKAGEVGDEDAALNSVAALAESFQPKGYTLSSTKVVTKVPPLIKHLLREYQHIGLDWLVTMYDKRLNGILADEMGLGKTIQTISLLAHLAYEKGNWGPHLIVVPTSVMLNWEMEFKKWCPGFKILTYYGSQKERKIKRTGWTKTNSFHVCITSYKLVIQDHQSFRRKRWKYLILDEAQNIKNFKSQRWQLLLNFNAQRRLLLTGTPLQNNLMELWSLMHFLMPNVFQSHREFREWFSNPVTGMVEGNAEYNENIIRRLHKVLRPFILRRLKSEVEKQLPQKYEHLVMCRLSKRQRFLYEEFMSRTRTKDTLTSGNLLSVINVLMQLRKVCNHPNLFEPRPVISPFQSDGISYVIPSLVWNIVDEAEYSKPSYPIFQMTQDDLYLSKEEAWKIQLLAPGFTRINATTETKDGVLTHIFNPETSVIWTSRSTIRLFKESIPAPPVKKTKVDIKTAVGSIISRIPPPPMPRLPYPVNFFLTTVDPVAHGLMDDPGFIDYISQGLPQVRKNPLLLPPAKNGGVDLLKPIERKSAHNLNDSIISVPSDPSSLPVNQETIDIKDTDSEEEGKSDDSDYLEIIDSTKKRKIAVAYKGTGTDGVLAMGLNSLEFQLPEIQQRALTNRDLVLTKLQKLNDIRCEKNPVYGQGLFETCEILPSRNRGRRQRYAKKCYRQRYPLKILEQGKGRFNLGFGEVSRVLLSKLKLSLDILPNHPMLYEHHTVSLAEMVLTLEERLETLGALLNRFVIYIPPVAAPRPQSKVFRPSPSRYAQQMYLEQEMKLSLRKPTEILHSVISSMSTQFPDPRLIQYDCGKLQTLDKLLRDLKAGTHRVLIFTQMARMLDVLEAFLTYHGHIYLRLDGATRIDQRQLLMERFNTDKRIFCFILSTRSGGIGVNLTGADTVIFYDSDWNPTMDAQAQDRCHRIGQTRDVHIYRLVSEMTVEENILKKSNQKRMLAEVTIEGGNFTTAYFTKSTIHDLFTVEKEMDPKKRLAELTAQNNKLDRGLLNTETAVVEEIKESEPITKLELDSEDKISSSQLFECALLAAEDEMDVKAARTVRAEAAAELAEFDETIDLDELDNTQHHEEPRKKSEIEEIFDQLNPVELYAVKLMEGCLEDWATDTYANAQKDLEKQKQEWEDSQVRHLRELEEEKEESEEEDVITYMSMEGLNQVWIAQNTNSEITMPLWSPPTPPRDDDDVFMAIDTCYGFLYSSRLIPDTQLPPIYIRPQSHPKKQIRPSLKMYDRPVSDFSMDVSETEDTATSKKSSPSKMQRRDEPIFAPRSLFDRPSPALAKLRRDYKLQKYSARPVGAPTKSTLGPGSISFPIIPPASAKAPPAAPPDMIEWLVAEDYALLQVIQTILELPLSLLVVNLAQTPNWDLAAEIVNMTSRTFRNPKQCKWRYENIVGPREEGKLFYETPALSPSSPAAKKKKTKAFIKIAPPSPSKAARYLKTSQLMSQDNNAQFTNHFHSKFDTIKNIANKRVPAAKPMTVSPSMKSNKQSAIFTEQGINYDNPLPATAIAQSRQERIQLERKKLIQQQQQQQQQVVVTGGVQPSPGTVQQQQQPNSILVQSIQSASSPIGVVTTPDVSKLTAGVVRCPFPSSTSNVVPLNSPGGILQPTAASLVEAQKRQQQQQQINLNLTQKQMRQQDFLVLQKQLQAQQNLQQSLAVVTSSASPGLVQQQQQTASLQLSMASQQILKQQLPQQQTQTVVLTHHGLAQALGGQVVNVSQGGQVVTSLSSSFATSPSTASALTKSVQSNPGQQMQRLTMQDLVSSASVTGVVQQQQQQTFVSLTPMTSTKLIQGNQGGVATFVQASPRLGGVNTLTQAQGTKPSPIQLQYLRQGALIRSQPATAITASQQQQQQVKEQQLQQQLKRIQVVTSSAAPNVTVSASQGALSMALSNVTVVQSSAGGSIFTQAQTPASGLTASALTGAQKSMPVMTLQSGTTTTIGQMVTQGATRQVQLVKQQTIGGKTVTRAVSDAEVAAILKQHGLTTTTTAQGRQLGLAPTGIGMPKTPQQMTQFPTHTLLTSVGGLQNIIRSPTTGGQQIATLVKTPTSQATSGTLSFPVQLSQLKQVNTMGGTGNPVGAKQQTQATVQQLGTFQQQFLLQQRQQRQQQQQQQQLKVNQTQQAPTQLIVQTNAKQLSSGLSMPQFQQVFKQVTASGQVIGQGGQVIHTHMLAKPMGGGTQNVIAVTSTANTPQQQQVGSLPGTLMGTGSQNLQTRVVPVSNATGYKQTIQVMAPGALLGPGTLARPPVPGSSQPSTYPTIKLSQGQPVSIRLQSAATVASAEPTIVTTMAIPPMNPTASSAGATTTVLTEDIVPTGTVGSNSAQQSK